MNVVTVFFDPPTRIAARASRDSPVVLAAGEVFEARRFVGQYVRICDVGEEGLFREAELQLSLGADRHVVEVLQTPLDSYAVAHLDHRAALLRLQEFDLRKRGDEQL